MCIILCECALSEVLCYDRLHFSVFLSISLFLSESKNVCQTYMQMRTHMCTVYTYALVIKPSLHAFATQTQPSRADRNHFEFHFRFVLQRGESNAICIGSKRTNTARSKRRVRSFPQTQRPILIAHANSDMNPINLNLLSVRVCISYSIRIGIYTHWLWRIDFVSFAIFTTFH